MYADPEAGDVFPVLASLIRGRYGVGGIRCRLVFQRWHFSNFRYFEHVGTIHSVYSTSFLLNPGPERALIILTI